MGERNPQVTNMTMKNSIVPLLLGVFFLLPLVTSSRAGLPSTRASNTESNSGRRQGRRLGKSYKHKNNGYTYVISPLISGDFLKDHRDSSDVVSDPTSAPTFDSMLATPTPTLIPTTQPTLTPTTQPTMLPTNQPTLLPTNQPTRVPSPGIANDCFRLENTLFEEQEREEVDIFGDGYSSGKLFFVRRDHKDVR